MRDIAKRVAIGLILVGAMLLGLHLLGPQGTAKTHEPTATADAQRPLKEGRIGPQKPAPSATTDFPDDLQRNAAAGDIAEAVEVLGRMLAAVASQSLQSHQHIIATFAAGVEENKKSLAALQAEVAELRTALQGKQKPPAPAKRAPKPKSEPPAAVQPSIGPWSTATTRTLHAVNSGVPPLHPQKSDP